MNYLDVIIIIPLVYAMIKGFSNGLIKEITGLLGLFLGVYIAINFSSYLNPKVIVFLNGNEELVSITSFTILFVLSIISIKLLGYIVDSFLKALALGLVSRLLGVVFGCLKTVVILSVLLTLAKEYKLIEKSTQKNSTLFVPLEKISKTLVPEINKQKQKIIEATEENTKKAKESIDQKLNLE